MRAIGSQSTSEREEEGKKEKTGIIMKNAVTCFATNTLLLQFLVVPDMSLLGVAFTTT